MATKTVYPVFILPIIFSIIFSSIVMAGILQEPGRQLNMWQFGDSTVSHDDSIRIVGLAKQYSTSTPVKVMINVDDTFFDCGDLYITIYSSAKTISAQNGYLEQCFGATTPLPLGDGYSQVIDIPGQYTMVAEMRDSEQKYSISTSEKFTVKQEVYYCIINRDFVLKWVIRWQQKKTN